MDFVSVIQQHYFNKNSVENVIDVQLSLESLNLKDESPYQTEIVYNRFFPYSDEIHEEATKALAEIKANFGRCVMIRDINPGCIYWTEMLTQYVLLYGLRFTKDDHIALIKLSYELVTVPNLQLSSVNTFGKILSILLKRKETISPSELELPWKPLYELCDKVFARKATDFAAFYMVPPSLKITLMNITMETKIYFPPSATQEILDELRPKLYPFDTKILNRTMEFLHWFLPVQLPVELHSIGHELWLHEFMTLWKAYHNINECENHLIQLMAKLASANIGYIDWNPYIPFMFTKFTRALNLPVRYKNISNYNGNQKFDMKSASKWIASVLGDKTNAQTYLDKFARTIETYFQPANYGTWMKKLENLFIHINYNVVLRIYRERHAKSTWEVPIPDNYKLTEANIDAFVNSMIPIATAAIYNKRFWPKMSTALNYLALLRPNLVIPKLLEKFDPFVDEAIEPHKLLNALVYMEAVARPLVQGPRYFSKDYAYADGSLHAIRLLFAALPGIDPNDPYKTYAALSMIYTYATLIPIVNCSNTNLAVSEEDRAICEETARFQDFVIQFMNKIFVLIQLSSVELVRLENTFRNDKNYQEAIIENILSNVFEALLLQCSSSIFEAALNKLGIFILTTNLEIKIAGQLVGVICKVFSQTNSKATMGILFPILANKFLEAIEEVLQEETLDSELLYWLLLLLNIVKTDGSGIMKYIDTIVEILEKVTQLKCEEGNILGCQMLQNVLESLCSIRATGFDKNLDDPEYPYWEDWGKSLDVDSIKIKWYVPGKKEMMAARKIFKKFFLPAITSVQDYYSNQSTMSRIELQTTLRIINSIIQGCDSVLPNWTEPTLHIKLHESCAGTCDPFIGNRNQIKMPNRDNVRKFLVQNMAALQEVMLSNAEDDTKSLMLLIEIWENVSVNKMNSSRIFFKNHTSFCKEKMILENKIIGDEGYLPYFRLKRVQMQNHLRNICRTYPLTPTYKDITMNLFQLSISQYSKIRIKAQIALWNIIYDYPNAHHLLVPRVIEILNKDPETNRAAYKGVLYLVVTSNKQSLLLNTEWGILSSLIPALVLTKPSENLNIIQHLEYITACVSDSFTKFDITMDIPDSCISMASELWNTGVPPIFSRPTQDDINKGLENLQKLEDSNLRAYNSILDSLSSALEAQTLHWRHREMAVHFINAILQPDRVLPTSIVRYFVNSLLDDSVDTRSFGLFITLHVFKQLKRRHVKIELDIPTQEKIIKPGPRPDNEWLQYSYENRPVTAEQWDKPRYIHKQHIGYYAWPKKLEVYAPSSQQPNLNRENHELNDQEKEIDAFFSNSQNIDTFMNFLKLEEVQEDYKLDRHCYLFFKGLFRNHGDAYLAHFLPHLREMVQNKQESIQCCAAEIICGLIRGAKHWPFDMTQRMWKNLLPIITLALASVNEKTINYWTACFSIIHANRDPSRLHWLIEHLVVESQVTGLNTSFLESAKLLLLKKALESKRWRVGEVLNKLMPQLEDRVMDNPFDNVRNQLALLLVMIFHANLNFGDEDENEERDYPQVDRFISNLYEPLQVLRVKENSKTAMYIKLSRVLNTVCKLIIESMRSSQFRSVACYYRLYLIVNQLESNETEDELSTTCAKTVAILAHAFAFPEHVPTILNTIDEASQCSSWSARGDCAKFIQVFLFHNMSTLISDERWISRILSIILRLLEDERVEVRENASQVLNGMLHCDLVADRQGLLAKFRETLSKSNTEIRFRHAAILGLCAFIQAHPYDIPEYVPLIFEYLSPHISAPQPIPNTIRKTLNDFKRTHCDTWTGLQGLTQYLTQEQFSLLQDLTIPPSYYA